MTRLSFTPQIAGKSVVPISVIIAAHNAEAFIGEAINSVISQTSPVSEVIVIADDCTDCTTKIARELGATVLEQKRSNMAAALNLGIHVSKQPWIAFLDADDVWHEEKISSQWKAIEAHADVGLVACDCNSLIDGEVIGFDQDLTQRWDNLSHRVPFQDYQYISQVDGEFLKRFYLQTSRILVRREAISKVGPLNESFFFWQTIEFFARILRHYPLAYVERPLVYQRLHNANHTRNVDGYWKAYICMIELMLENPGLYPPRAGEAYRECLKRDFHVTERMLSQLRSPRNLSSS